MRGFSNLILCLLMATPVFADDDPFSEPAKAPPGLPKAQAKKKLEEESPQVPDPFGTDPPAASQADPFGTPGTPSGSADPFGTSGTPPASPDDPFGSSDDDPFAAPTPRNAAPSKRATPARPGQRAGQTIVPMFPSLALGSSEAVQRIEHELASATRFDYLDTPLKDVIEEIALLHNIPIIIHVSALEDFGIGTDTPVTINLSGVSLRSSLQLMLRELDLTYVIADEVMQITTPEFAESTLRSRFYRVSSILPPDRDGSYLIKLITGHVVPDCWDDVGGAGSISFVDHLETLVVTQTEDVHNRIDTLLSSVAKLAIEPPGR